MAFTIFEDTAITGVSAAVPKTVIRNIDNTFISKHELETVIKTVGVKERRWSISLQTASDLCVEAANVLLRKKNISASDIDALIFMTQSPDYIAPATSHVIAYRLGLSVNALCFDINLGCSSFCYGVHIASSLVVSSGLRRVLVLIGDSDKGNGYGKSNSSLLFGHAGAAVMVERKAGAAINSLLRSDGSRYTAIITRNGGSRHPAYTTEAFANVISMTSGEDVLAFSMSDVPKTIREFLGNINKTANDFDYIVLHQANLMMLQIIAKKLHVGMEKVPVSLDRYGNVNGASVPLTICDLRMREQLPERVSFLASASGVGLSWGCTAFEMNVNDIFPVIETDSYYDEAF